MNSFGKRWKQNRKYLNKFWIFFNYWIFSIYVYFAIGGTGNIPPSKEWNISESVKVSLHQQGSILDSCNTKGALFMYIISRNGSPPVRASESGSGPRSNLGYSNIPSPLGPVTVEWGEMGSIVGRISPCPYIPNYQLDFLSTFLRWGWGVIPQCYHFSQYMLCTKYFHMLFKKPFLSVNGQPRETPNQSPFFPM